MSDDHDFLCWVSYDPRPSTLNPPPPATITETSGERAARRYLLRNLGTWDYKLVGGELTVKIKVIPLKGTQATEHTLTLTLDAEG